MTDRIVDPTTGRTADMHSRVRKVLQHHKLTVHGDGVVEADLIEAVLDSIRTAGAAAAMPPRDIPEGWVIQRKDKPPFKRIEIIAPNKYSTIVDSLQMNPENILYMLAEQLLNDTAAQGEKP